MKILTAEQTRAVDQATQAADNISSAELMERAATAFVAWLTARLSPAEAGEVLVLCGSGNNGGDGLAVARLLQQRGYRLRVALLPADKYAPDFTTNQQRLPAAVPVGEVGPSQLPAIAPGQWVIDALFGTGLSRPLAGLAATLVRHLNKAQARVVAIDVPSGLFTDASQPADSVVVRARHTVGFELPKLAYFLAQNAAFVGRWHVVPIGLAQSTIEKLTTPFHLVDEHLLAGRLLPRGRFSHKGTYGHALLLAGSQGKIGAAVLAARACLRSGVGLLTVRVPGIGYDVLQTSVPEAMALVDPHTDCITELPDLEPYKVVGMGPGLGQADETLPVLRQLLQHARAQALPLVLDADALNLLGRHRDLLAQLPPDTILTPHPKEFERLTEPARDDYHRLDLLREFCQRHRCYVVLKGGYSCLGTPEGTLYFNTTGNPGMGTGGTGDVLTGVLTALRAQPLNALDAALLGVYAHGRAGDLAAAETGEAGLCAGDLAQYLGPAFRELTAPDEL